MRRYWIEKKHFKNDAILLTGDTFHHICEVCRQDVGNKFEILCDGQAYFVEITERLKKSATAKILETREAPKPQKPYIHLCVSISKFPTMDTIIEKAVELGVYQFHPFVSDFSFIRDPKSDRLRDKLARWERIVRAATSQTGRGDLMEVAEISNLSKLIEKMNQNPASVGLFPYEGSADTTVGKAIERFKSLNPENIWLFVGSEGGYSDAEVDFFKKHGLESSSLGDQVLRVETACLSLVSILKYEFTS